MSIFALQPSSDGSSPEVRVSTKPRLESLDAFRGLTIAAMILVNDPGDWRAVYAPLLHAQWHGWTPTDLVFPFFLFIMGAAIEFSCAFRNTTGPAEGRTTRPALLHIFYRTALLFALGLFLNGFPFFAWHSLRVMGVLQRIAICYLVSALLVLKSGAKTRIAAAASLLLGYWALMTLVPVPGYGAGHLDPESNLAGYIDRTLFPGRTWKPLWDPEGLLSTLPAISSTLLGSLAGRWMRTEWTGLRKTADLFVAAIAGIALGQIWNIWFPINKNLWTSSYVLFTTGLACALLATFYWLIEVKNHRRWTVPLLAFGKNAIGAYLFSELLSASLFSFKFTWQGRETSWQGHIYQHAFAPVASPQMASLLFAVAFLSICWALFFVLYRKKIFFKL